MRLYLLFLVVIINSTHASTVNKEYQVTVFGAMMDGITDDTAAFQAALDALPDRGVLKIPAGDAVLSKVLYLQNKTAVIRGSGSGVTRLIWNQQGGLHLMETRTWSESVGQKASWEVRGIAFVTSVPDGGTAVFADFKSSDRLNPSVVVEDCRFEGDSATAGWTKSFHGHNSHIGRLSGCNFRGNDATEAHIHLSGNSTCFIIDSCHGMKSVYGVIVEGKTEGVTISKCFFVHNKYGFVLNIEEGGEPMFNIMNSHASSGVYPIWIKNGRSSSIVGNALFMNRCAKYTDAPESREGIRIEGKLAKDIVISANTIQITDKAFHGTFAGIRAVSCNGLIVTGNTIANNSSTDDDFGIIVEQGVRQPSVSGNIFHLHSGRTQP